MCGNPLFNKRNRITSDWPVVVAVRRLEHLLRLSQEGDGVDLTSALRKPVLWCPPKDLLRIHTKLDSAPSPALM